MRTFMLIGGLVALIAPDVSTAMAAIMLGSIVALLVAGFVRQHAKTGRSDTTTMAAAFDSYFHYAGPWRIEGEEVLHTVTMSLIPDMTGTDQRRLAKFDAAGGLTLSAHEALSGGASRHHILQ